MNNSAHFDAITKVSQWISVEVNLGNWFRVEKSNPIFEDSAIEIIRKEISIMLERLGQIRENHELPQIKTAVVGNVEVILSSPKKKWLMQIADRLKNWKKWKDKDKEEERHLPIETRVSHDPFWNIHLKYQDGEDNERIFPIPLTIRLSDNGVEWPIYWTVLSNALAKKFQFFQILSEKKRKKEH